MKSDKLRSSFITTAFVICVLVAYALVFYPSSAPHFLHPTLSKHFPSKYHSFRWSEGCEDYQLRHQREKDCKTLSKILYSSQNVYLVENDELSYIYCAIPKTGCTYQFSLLIRVKFDVWSLTPSIVHNKERTQSMKLGYQSNPRIASLLSDHSVPKYAMIRNPMQRTLSAYKNKVEGYMPEEERTPETFYKWLKDEFPTDSWNRTEAQWRKTNPHWKPQSQFCGFHYPDIPKQFKVFRFEQPEEFVDYIYKHIPGKYLETGWGDGNSTFRESTLGKRTRTGRTNIEFFNYFISLEMFDYLAEQLKEDIDGLGYRKEVDELREEVKRRA